MRSEGGLSVTGDAELDYIRARVTTTIGLLDQLIARRRRAHLRLVPTQAPVDAAAVADGG